MVDAQVVANDTREAAMDAIQRNTRLLGSLADVERILVQLAALPTWGDVQYVSLDGSYCAGMTVNLYITLKNDTPTTFVRDAVRTLGTSASKRKGWSGNSLIADMTVGTIRVAISGYVPPTCAIVYDEVIEPAREARTVRKARILCEPGTTVLTSDDPR